MYDIWQVKHITFNMETEVRIKALEYEVQFYGVDVPKYIDTNCNQLTFLNLGTATALIENVPLVQNQSLVIGGNAGEITNQRFFINFVTGVGLTQNVVVILKRYRNL